MTHFPKIVRTPHYHVWTDALHAKALAHQARNKWDRGTYVRWCVATAWSALEVACQDATGDDSISYRFKRNLDLAINRLCLPSLNWGSGIWQRVTKVQECRKGYLHRFVKETDLFSDAAVADQAIEVIRCAIIDIYEHVGRPAPPWTADDDDRGWDKGRQGWTGNLTAVRAGADPDSDDAIKICFVNDGVEHTSEVLPPGAHWQPYVDGLIRSVRVPISEVRVYQGQVLLESRELPMRGA